MRRGMDFTEGGGTIDGAIGGWMGGQRFELAMILMGEALAPTEHS